MKVRVVLIGYTLIVEPDPAVVVIGEPMYWEFSAALRNPLISWEVYFRDESPFGPGLQSLTAQTAFDPITPAGSSPTHRGMSPSVIAARDGHYEYGVRARDLTNDRVLANRDPELIILQ
ncbi:hypothetical protein EVC45_23640 [Paraburkholderia sp. UYCP14C]|uniref:hypothetical protein n=1 Tax=Paraburkholderia sp. UYCP14C TaxID=2511130 RepID=UPI00101F20B9|nr:hypothetical protein [Paraburkholderia sp. UYCP14C]RZF27352.1 hypothetical protein EVC45_23640 [Paraburkholderia sp. UYCP14C]